GHVKGPEGEQVATTVFGEGERTVEVIELDPDLGAVGQSRSFVVGVLERWGLTPLVLDASLVTSELVSNAVIHARTQVELRASRLPDGVRIEVRDGAEYGIDAHRPGRGPTDRGLGLRVVSQLTSRWGVDPVPDGKTVWAEVTTRSASQTAPSDPEVSPVGPAPLPLPDDWPEIRLVGVPVRLVFAWEDHVRNLMREFALVSPRSGGGGIGDVDPVELVVATLDRYWEAMRPIWAQARSLQPDADGRVTVMAKLPERVVLDGPRFLEAMEAADHLARQGRLLTEPADDELVAFRRWFIHAVVRQVASVVDEERCPF
ncbi:MAG TPA: ATP-binding protein, partial [Acidimicrobiales bacterium]|nr:ATP-binding protein [Acidimicrobiales bacterium]